jgi:hypothetical protein
MLQIDVFPSLRGLPHRLSQFHHLQILFFLKYQPSAANRQVIGEVGIQAWANRDFLTLPLKTSLKGWHTQWFYCENHEPRLPPFVGNLFKYDGTWTEEPIDSEMSAVLALAEKVSKLKGLGLTGVGVGTNWLARRVIPLKKQVHPS